MLLRVTMPSNGAQNCRLRQGSNLTSRPFFNEFGKRFQFVEMAIEKLAVGDLDRDGIFLAANVPDQ